MKRYKILSIAVLAFVCLTVMSCHNKNDEDSQSGAISEVSMSDDNMLLRDSLEMARDYMNSLSTLVNEVSDGLNEIKRMEQIVSTTNFSQETADKRDQMRNDILLIKNSIQERMNRLAQLEEKLTNAEANNKYNEESRKSMLQTIANLKQQLADQQIMIDNLTAKLDAANAQIKDLSGRVDSLKVVNTNVNAENSNLKKENQRVNDEKKRAVDEQNVCYYAIGSKKELKNHKIIDTGFLRKTKVMQNSNIMHSYFTKADKRTLNEINLHSKKFKLLTTHPEGSYSVGEVNGVKVLRIINSALFWQYSNYLVVQVD
ncbi:MAG: hypothetical protein IKX31_07905 [Muribaculaceae bacterium]|nr:hypothetical protein [Muribaculaceae bacterium]